MPKRRSRRQSNCMPFIRRDLCERGSAEPYVENMGSFFFAATGSNRAHLIIFTVLSFNTGRAHGLNSPWRGLTCMQQSTGLALR